MTGIRRKEKEITDSTALEEIVRTARVLRLGLCDDGVPYIVPVCFGYEPGTFWIHSAPEGRKISILRVNPRICYEMDEVLGFVQGEEPCRCGMKYASIVGSGRAEFVRDPEDKAHGLNIIMHRYTGNDAFTFPEAALEKTCVIRITVDEMRGKRSGC